MHVSSIAKIENTIFMTLNVVNIIVYILIFTASIVKAHGATLGEIMQSVYCSALSVLLLANEVKLLSFTQVYFGFLHTFRGKGLLMILLGCAVMCHHVFNIIVAIFSFTLGLAYIIISFLPNTRKPYSFWTHWQCHKDLCAVPSLLFAKAPSIHSFINYPHPSTWHPSPQASPYIMTSQPHPSLLTPPTAIVNPTHFQPMAIHPHKDRDKTRCLITSGY
ncbi:COPI associated protein-domain-containing protein [Radiomyces spectabilis]|uniref:COPI associated protein-domain-containing protein n=1 Tax=Radiomyces spectabilis TaxID=64574 RepID=UPI00221F5106|nr:COPI associated protein-domain-containing protein [Radiomyces spectabilis]KAI8391558.1 COPI associated protein-domain-containing protein [Radiomyces spectabilis]